MKHFKRYTKFVNEMLESVYIPSNVKEFAKRKGVMHIVKMVAGWAEKAGKRINGGTAIGKNYDTLILDLRHQGSEIRINLGSDDITLHGHKVTDAKSFKNALAFSESIINEGQSTIGITTHGDAVIDGIDDLTGDLDKAKIKYKYNRLTMTLSVFNMDKKFFKKAKKIIDDSGFGILLAKESVVNEGAKFKNTKDFEAFLEEIDGMGESQIKKIMGKDYIDTPGFYSEEAEDYDNDITEFMISNMGTKEFEQLKDYWENNVAESVVNEAVSRATKIYQIATPATKAMLVRELEDLFGDDYRHIVTEFDDDEGYESVLVFNLTKNDIKRIQEEIADVLIWEYSIKKGKEISESVVMEGTTSVVLSNEILDFLQERGLIKGSDAQKVHKDLTSFLREKGIEE